MAIAVKSDSNPAVFPGGTFRICSSSVVKPPWLLSTLAELDTRIKELTYKTAEEDNNGGETFAERAESYYQKRPQLFALLQDLYNAYTSLSDRYIRTAAKIHHPRISATNQDCSYDQEEDTGASQIDSDAESSLSYQLPPLSSGPEPCTIQDPDGLIAIKNVDCDILPHEVNLMARKIELQKSLLEVVESERLILLNENASLVAECAFMKRKAGEMARWVLKMREDDRVCKLSRKIEDLQWQIYRLEKRNKEYLVKKDEVIEEKKSKNEKGVGLEACFQIRKLKLSKKENGWWEKVKNFDMFLCG